MTNPEIEKKYFCSEHEMNSPGAKEVQKRYVDKFDGKPRYYLVSRCPVCQGKFLPMWSYKSRRWKGIPIDETIPDEFLDYLNYISEWT